MMLGPQETFTFLFVMLGPLKLLGPFVQRTRGLDDATVRQIAFWAFLIATAGIIAGGLIGCAVLAKWHVSIPALQITAGIVFFLVALRHVLEPYEPVYPPAPEPLPPTP